jgi:NADH-quinone oxidoreductase subunit B
MELEMETGFLKEQQSLQNDLNSKASHQSSVDFLMNWFTKQSIFVLAYGTGCGAIEMPPTLTSRYDAERLGIRGAATPRQADVLIVSGYCSYKTLRRIIRTYEQMSNPKYVLALGSCTLNGGMYWDSYNTIKTLEDYIPVDMYVNGCMPRPESILEGFIQLQKEIGEGSASSWQKYEENYEFYRKNQEAILGNDVAPSYDANWYLYDGGL